MLRRFSSKTISCVAGTAWRFANITPVAMPALSPTMEAGKIVEWNKKVGEEIGNGDSWCQVETDKAAVSFDNVSEEGFIARILVEAGGDATKVGAPIALLVDDAADVNSDEVKNWKAPAAAGAAPVAAPAEPAAAAPTPVAAAAPTSAANDGSRTFASPLARNIAKELGINIGQVKGTGGVVGRVIKDDVVAFASSPQAQQAAAPAASSASTSTPPPPPAAPGATFEDIPVTGMRATIAKRLTQSKNVDVPHYYESNDCRADNMTALIKHLNKKGDGNYKISVNDYLIKAIARANLIVPQCNTHWHGDIMRKYNNVDVSVAVATPSGLITPIIKNAHAKGLVEISQEMKALAKKAKEGSLAPDQYQGGTITLSNLGGMATESFTAIINPPQSTIIAAGTIVPRPEIKKNEDGEFEMTGKVETVINLTASFDHRVVDGAVGAEWFKHLKDSIENPMSLLL